jgi:hypothetical protein
MKMIHCFDSSDMVNPDRDMMNLVRLWISLLGWCWKATLRQLSSALLHLFPGGNEYRCGTSSRGLTVIPASEDEDCDRVFMSTNGMTSLTLRRCFLVESRVKGGWIVFGNNQSQPGQITGGHVQNCHWSGGSANPEIRVELTDN